MCGIFAYKGTRQDAPQLVLEGLRLLEYRGYDSWGIAYITKDQIEVRKEVGKIDPKATFRLCKSTSAVGHTRWATHGEVTFANAHPHLSKDGSVAIVHNGIVENFTDLKKVLRKKKYRFTTQTDTEIIVHLIEEYLKKNGSDEAHFITAVQNTFKKLKGLNAFVAIYKTTGTIVAVKNGSPLVVGQSPDGYYISSDVISIIPHTRNIFFLEDNELVVLTRHKNIQLRNVSTSISLKLRFRKLDWEYTSISKGRFPHFLLKEIFEQPHILNILASSHEKVVRDLVIHMQKAYGTFMVGCGTASYASLYGSYIFSRVAKKHINAAVGSEFKYLEDYITARTLVVPISQSGETIDVVEPIKSAKKKGAHIIAITNTLGSTLYRQSDSAILIGAGVERSVVATKSFTAMVGMLLCAAYDMVGQPQQATLIVRKTVKGLEQILSPSFIKTIKRIANILSVHEHVYILGRGMSYAAALEAALKLKETAYIHAEGFAGGELKHGVITLIEKGTPCIVFTPDDETHDEIVSNAQEVRARGAFVIGIGTKPNEAFDLHIKIEDVQDANIILQVGVIQLLAYYLALSKGIKDPDKPRNLAKSVTVK